MRRLPRRVGAGVAVVIAIAAVIAIVLAVGSSSPSGGATSGSPNSAATTVQRRNLVETDTESGTLSYAEPQTVYNRLSGTVTWLPSVGQVIKPGDALYRVSGEPVILMNGTTPAYRDLSAADSPGPDILELNRNLVRLGFNPEGIVVDDVWQAATTDAVEVFQESLGQTATGILSLGQVVFLPGNQVVSALETSVGSTGGGSGSPANSSAAGLSRTASSPEFVSLTKTTPRTTPPTGHPKAHSPAKPTKPKTPRTLSALLALLRAETAELGAAQAQLRAAEAASHSSNNRHNGSHPSGSGSSNHSHSGSGGSGGGGSGGSGGSPGTGGGGSGGSPSSSGASASAILQTSSTHLVATVDLDASKQSEAKVGEKVTVEMPSGDTVNGTVTAVSSVATTSSNSGSGNGNGSGNGGGGNGGNGNGNGGNGSSTPTIPVTISLRGHLAGPGLDQAAVSVNFAQAEANNVLSVPVTALLAISGGRYAVQDAAAPHRVIPVTTGLFAAGYVQISGPGVYPGLEVTDSQG